MPPKGEICRARDRSSFGGICTWRAPEFHTKLGMPCLTFHLLSKRSSTLVCHFKMYCFSDVWDPVLVCQAHLPGTCQVVTSTGYHTKVSEN